MSLPEIQVGAAHRQGAAKETPTATNFTRFYNSTSLAIRRASLVRSSELLGGELFQGLSPLNDLFEPLKKSGSGSSVNDVMIETNRKAEVLAFF